eukprot:TRINITY_DN4988_c0_g1_i1.p1 TRINITY_DN4988_c0_g1~~TRINITY_DN4988_c0_g1_i1.p1  ORF type:complete len:552 (+),score=103.71 TRINITY_DN4988_c0_g1_i1:128-1783(+)
MNNSAWTEPIAGNFNPQRHDGTVMKEVVEYKQTVNELHQDESDSDGAHQSGVLVRECDASSFAPSNVSDITKQHYEWAHELESVDQKQADLVVLQWKLVRNQTGMLAQQLVDMRKTMEDLAKDQQNTTVKMEHYQRENENFESRIKLFVRQLFDKAEQNLMRVRQEIEVEAQKRETAVTEVSKRVLDVREEARKATDSSLTLEVRKMRTEVNSLMQQMPGLKEHMAQLNEEMRGSVDGVMDHVRKVRDLHDKAKTDHATHGEALETRMRGHLEKESTERDDALKRLHSFVSSLHSDHGSFKEELAPLRNRLQDVEDRSLSTHKDVAKVIDAKLTEPSAKLQALDRRLEHIQASINQESLARHSLAEVFEQMLKTERTKLMNLITQKAAFARLDCENMQKTLTEQIEKEASDRGSHAESLAGQIARFRASINDRLSICETECQSVDQKYHAMQNEVHEFDMRQRKLEDQLHGMLRTCVAELQTAIAEERTCRENADNDLEERMEYLGDIHDKVRETFVQKGPRSMRLSNSVPSTPCPPANDATYETRDWHDH